MSPIAPAGEAPSSNVLIFPGGQSAVVPQRRPDADLLAAAGLRLSMLAESAAAVRRALDCASLDLPSGTLEWLVAIEGQIEMRAAMIEHEALVAQGASEIA